jgi:hypothetical protein
MIVIIGLLALVAAVVVTVAAAVTNTGSTHTVGDSFVIFGQHASGLTTGQLFMCGVAVGVVGMLGLSLLLGAFARRLPSRASRRDLKDAQAESAALRLECDRLAQELGDQRSDRPTADGTIITLDKAPDQPADAVPSLVDRSGTR